MCCPELAILQEPLLGRMSVADVQMNRCARNKLVWRQRGDMLDQETQYSPVHHQ
jgi:hypothetical protein